MKNYSTRWSDELVESCACCDSKIDVNDNQTTNFLNDIECVPFIVTIQKLVGIIMLLKISVVKRNKVQTFSPKTIYAI